MKLNDYSWHKNALKGQFGNATRIDPQSGYYSVIDDKTGMRVPAAIWFDQHQHIQASIGYEGSDANPYTLWKKAWMNPISESNYYDAVENSLPIQEPDGSNAAGLLLSDIELVIADAQPLLDPELTNLVEDVKARDHLADIAAQLTDLSNKATACQKAELDPLNAQVDAVRKRWRPAQDRASNAARDIKGVIGHALKIVKHKAEEMGIEAKTNAGTGRARAIGLRNVKSVEVFDRAALVKQIMSMNEPVADFDEALEKIARRMLTAGASVEGARFIMREIAA